ncbi:50S ribosomal protein L21 [Ferrithrix thermotolerans]|nr:50S ribosomal protein L21 [Ferrithrix thermotolerans]
MYAVIKTGGKQEKVEEGSILNVELLGANEGDTVTFTPILLVDGAKVVHDQESLLKAKVTAVVVGESKGPKIVGFHYSPKARARKRWGHRQHYNVLRVVEVAGS